VETVAAKTEKSLDLDVSEDVAAMEAALPAVAARKPLIYAATRITTRK
jgi:CO dehydrogenase/acetyl-CoA synthase gamma subunit (corrinoid Fe-S protein)